MKSKHRPDAYTVGDLSRRLNFDPADLRKRIYAGRISCDQQPPGKPKGWDPVISRDAAIEFCISVGLDPMRVAR